MDASGFPLPTELVGETPVVRLARVTSHLECEVLLKLEQANVGGSVKDRVGRYLIEAAERDGRLQPGGTIVEPTSGNTGIGLAIAAIEKGYRCIFTVPAKTSVEKVNLLRAYGAEVIVCPNVPRDDERSYYNVSDRLAATIPGAFKPDQYTNPANPATHYEWTGPELWRQVGGRLDAFVCGPGTGGTISGVGRFLKEQDPHVRVVGSDPEGSIYSSPDGTTHPYLVEAIGKDFFPETFDTSVVDEYQRIPDREALDMARRLAREEGLLVGGSAGAAVVAAIRVAGDQPAGARVVVLLPDTGRNYLSKYFDPEWLLENGAIDAGERDELLASPAAQALADEVAAPA